MYHGSVKGVPLTIFTIIIQWERYHNAFIFYDFSHIDVNKTLEAELSFAFLFLQEAKYMCRK